jgi:hypothetical protein
LTKNLLLILISLFLFGGCTYNSEPAILKGKWICVRLDKSVSEKNDFEVFRQVQIKGTIFEFKNKDRLDIVKDHDTSGHYYTLSADKRFLMYGLMGDVAGLHKIILLNRDSFKMSMNYSDTVVFAKIK